MSVLSETLARCLQELQHPTPVKKVEKIAVPIPISPIVLYYDEGTSDKVYHIWVEQREMSFGVPTFDVKVRYGRRGGTLIPGTKTKRAVPIAEATSIYRRLVAEKKAKGYKE